jgi:hypothetical protein
MAELQYIINVKCINAKLAEIMTGELGDLIIVNIPKSTFTPQELDKLIDATKIIKDQASKNRIDRQREETQSDQKKQEKYEIGLIEKRKRGDINVLQSGELVLVNMHDLEFAPSEFDDLIKTLEATKNLSIKLRSQKKNNTK